MAGYIGLPLERKAFALGLLLAACAAAPKPRPEAAGPKPAALRKAEAELRGFDEARPLRSDVSSEPAPWPPTAYSVGVDRLGLLRRPAKAPTGAPPRIDLPAVPRTGTSVGRLDSWRSFGKIHKGRVIEIKVHGRWLEAPTGKLGLPEADPFFRYLCLLEIDPQRAAAEGVTHVASRIKGLGAVRQQFPKVVSEFRVGVSGSQRGYLLGLKLLLEHGADRRAAAVRMVEQGRVLDERALVQWAFALLEDEWRTWPRERKKVAEPLMLAATLLGEDHAALAVAFVRLREDGRDPAANRCVADVLAGPFLNLQEMAALFYRRAGDTRRQAEILVDLGRFGEAERVLGQRGDAALRARVALGRGDLARARRLAPPGAHQLLGGIAYASGDAAEAERRFRLAVAADPRGSTASSDLGLALAVQGKDAAASLCFLRAAELDPLNPAPWVGEAFLLFSTSAVEAARALAVRDRSEFLPRAYYAMALDHAGESQAAAQEALSILRRDYRFRLLLPLVAAFRDPARLDRALALAGRLPPGSDRQRIEKGAAWRRRGYDRTWQNEVAVELMRQSLAGATAQPGSLRVQGVPCMRALLLRYILLFCPASRAAQAAAQGWEEVDPSLRKILEPITLRSSPS